MNENTLSPDTARRIRRHIDNLASTDESVAIAAERRLIRYESRAVDALMAVCTSENPQVRFRAVYALGKIGDPRALDRLIHAAQDTDPRVAYDAVIALGELADPRAVTPLLELIEEIQREEGKATKISDAGRESLNKLGHPL